MIDVLLFGNNNLEGEKKKDERIECFKLILNDAFKQFQKLYDDYKEFADKHKEPESNSSNILHKLQNIPKDADIECGRCTAAKKEGNMISEKECLANVNKVDCDPVTVTSNRDKESFKPGFEQPFQIFSEDFCTQGLEESFVRQSGTPLQEIQNVTPKRAKSPILGSKRRRTRVTSPLDSSPNLSQKSVLILDDFNNEKCSKVDNLRTSNVSSDSNSITTSTNALSTSIKLASAAPEPGLEPATKNIRKWGISTIQNVSTDIIAGTNKKLKQSKLFVKAEKVTDLSNCDDVFINKSDDRDQASRTRDVISKSFTQTNNNCLEDSVIPASPEKEKRLSKTRQRMAGRNKSSETVQQKFNVDKNVVWDKKHVNTLGSWKNDVDQMDTDMTIFDPKLSSTQYPDLPSCSKTLQREKLPVKEKPELGERIDVRDQGVNDSNVIDETLFIENVVPTDSRLQKRMNFETSIRKKLSLKKIRKLHRNPEAIESDKVISGLEMDISMDTSSPDEMEGASRPKKKLALANFDVLPTKKKNASPTYAYKCSPVRSKSERALLNGWSCLKCQNYYEGTGLTGEELQIRKNKCSRHRSKFNERQLTQKDYWEPEFPNTFNSTIWSED